MSYHASYRFSLSLSIRVRGHFHHLVSNGSEARVEGRYRRRKGVGSKWAEGSEYISGYLLSDATTQSHRAELGGTLSLETDATLHK